MGGKGLERAGRGLEVRGRLADMYVSPFLHLLGLCPFDLGLGGGAGRTVSNREAFFRASRTLAKLVVRPKLVRGRRTATFDGRAPCWMCSKHTLCISQAPSRCKIHLAIFERSVLNLEEGDPCDAIPTPNRNGSRIFPRPVRQASLLYSPFPPRNHTSCIISHSGFPCSRPLGLATLSTSEPDWTNGAFLVSVLRFSAFSLGL